MFKVMSVWVEGALVLAQAEAFRLVLADRLASVLLKVLHSRVPHAEQRLITLQRKSKTEWWRRADH